MQDHTVRNTQEHLFIKQTAFTGEELEIHLDFLLETCKNPSSSLHLCWMCEWDNAESSKYTGRRKTPQPKFTKRDYELTIKKKRWLRLTAYHLFLQKSFSPFTHKFHFSWKLNSQDNNCTNALQARVCQPAVFTVSALVLWRQAESELSSLLNFPDWSNTLSLMPSVFHQSVKSTGDKISMGNRPSDLIWFSMPIADVRLHVFEQIEIKCACPSGPISGPILCNTSPPHLPPPIWFRQRKMQHVILVPEAGKVF